MRRKQAYLWKEYWIGSNTNTLDIKLNNLRKISTYLNDAGDCAV
jgi:hypothetical protein